MKRLTTVLRGLRGEALWTFVRKEIYGMRRFFGRKILGFVPGWIALVLVLGGMAGAAAPVFHGNVFSDAAQNQSGGSGTVGPVVVAQATSEPTVQPGNPYVNSYIMGDGQSNGLWQICLKCSTFIGAYNLGHYHLLWANFPGDASGPADIALGGCALCAGDASTTGENEALGVGALENKTDHTPLTGYANIGVGNIALGYLTSGSGNNAFGVGAGECISTGSNNTIIGDGWSYAAGGCTGSGNVFVGQAGFEASTSIANSVLIGNTAGQYATSSTTVAIGNAAGEYATGSNGDGVFIGDGAGKGASGSDDSRSVDIGASAGVATTTGNNNVFIGFQAGNGNTSGNTNTFIGYQAAVNVTTGGADTAIGNASCGGLTTGTWNICIGNNATLPSATGNGQMSIANAIYGFGNALNTTGISTGCIAFYQTSCTNGTVASAVPIIAPNGSATSCTGGHQFANGIMVISGAGAPTCTAPAASMYLRSDGASGSHIYISQGGGTWTAISGV